MDQLCRTGVAESAPKLITGALGEPMSHSFEKDPRKKLQREADLDSVDVTISMYAVRDHKGERKPHSVFQAEKSDWVAAEGTYRQFTAETEFDAYGLPSYEQAGEVWLVTDRGTPGPGLLRVSGAAEVQRTKTGGELAWIWIHPLRRGSGSDKKYTKQLAERLRSEYGTVAPLPTDTLTPAGRRFLKKYFPAPQAAEAEAGE